MIGLIGIIICRGEDRYGMKMKFNDESFSETVEKFISGTAQRFDQILSPVIFIFLH